MKISSKTYDKLHKKKKKQKKYNKLVAEIFQVFLKDKKQKSFGAFGTAELPLSFVLLWLSFPRKWANKKKRFLNGVVGINEIKNGNDCIIY